MGAGSDIFTRVDPAERDERGEMNWVAAKPDSEGHCVLCRRRSDYGVHPLFLFFFV